jgi:ATP synthase protein I
MDPPVFSAPRKRPGRFFSRAMTETDRGSTPPASEKDDFATRLAAARERQGGGRETTSDVAARNAGQLGIGFRIAADLLAGVMVGVGIGLALDRWLGTSPWSLIVFLVLGFGAGMTNMLRTVRANDAARARIDAERRERDRTGARRD